MIGSKSRGRQHDTSATRNGLRKLMHCSSQVRGSSGAGTNLKAGEAPIQREAPEIFIFGRAPPHFGDKSTISRFGERFRDGQYSFVSFLFTVLLLIVPPSPAICKSGGGTCPPSS